jgi:hypothetical protein
VKNDGMEVVEGSVPSEMEKEIVHGMRVGYVGALATPGVIAPTVDRERERGRK